MVGSDGYASEDGLSTVYLHQRLSDPDQESVCDHSKV
jgi:hypothetical protein